MASNEIQRTLLEGMFFRFAAVTNNPILLGIYDLFLTYIACF